MRDMTPRTPLQVFLVGVVLLYASILLIAPIFSIIGGAFEEGVQPVIDALVSESVLNALRLTFILAGLSTLINTITGIIIAWVLVRHEFPGKWLLNSLVDLPFVVSPVIVGYVIIVLFGRTGWFKDLPFQIAFSWPGMLLVTIFVSLPFVIREVIPVLEAQTLEQEEAAYTLGAGPWLTFRRIVLPAIRNGILYGIVLTLARSLGEFGAAAVVGGGVEGVTETATLYIFRASMDRNEIGSYSVAIVLGLLSVIILISMNLLQRQRASRENVYVDRTE